MDEVVDFRLCPGIAVVPEIQQRVPIPRDPFDHLRRALPKNANIFASQYELYLPSREDLRERLMQWTAEEEGRG